MILTLIAGIVTGFVVSVPPLGPVAFALISKGFKNEFREGLSIAIGTALMDFIYAMIAFGGVSLFISLLPDSIAQFYRNNLTSIQIVLIYAGCIIVIYYGIKIKRSKISYDTIQQKQIILDQTQLKAAEVQKAAHDMTKVALPPEPEKSNHFALILMGIMLCISSITLPASWIAIVGYIKGLGIIQSTFWGGFLFSVGAFIGTVLWFFTLLKLITGNSHRINPLTIDKLNVGAGIVLILLGILLFVKATVEIFHIFI